MRTSVSLLIVGCWMTYLAGSTAWAQGSGWGWDRNAGAKMEGNFGGAGTTSYGYDYGYAYPAGNLAASGPPGGIPYTTGYGNYDLANSAGYGSCPLPCQPQPCQPQPCQPASGGMQPPRLPGGPSQGYSGAYQSGYGRYSLTPDSVGPTLSVAGPDEARPAPVHVGDRVQPADRTAPLMIGDRVVATVESGQVLPVLDIQGPWVGTIARQQDRDVRGWIHIDQLAPVSVATTRIR